MQLLTDNTGAILQYGTIEQYDGYCIVNGNHTIGNTGDTQVIFFDGVLPELIRVLPAEPTHKYIDGEIVPIEPVE